MNLSDSSPREHASWENGSRGDSGCRDVAWSEKLIPAWMTLEWCSLFHTSGLFWAKEGPHVEWTTSLALGCGAA